MGGDRASRARGSSSSIMHYSVVPRSMSVVFGLGTRLCVRMRTKLENGVLHNEQCCEWLLLTRVNLKRLSGWEAACCDEHPFCANIKVSA